MRQALLLLLAFCSARQLAGQSNVVDSSTLAWRVTHGPGFRIIGFTDLKTVPGRSGSVGVGVRVYELPPTAEFGSASGIVVGSSVALLRPADVTATIAALDSIVAIKRNPTHMKDFSVRFEANRELSITLFNTSTGWVLGVHVGGEGSSFLDGDKAHELSDRLREASDVLRAAVAHGVRP